MQSLKQNRITYVGLGVAIGLVMGLVLQGFWPNIPLHATATHGQDNFAIATGYIDSDLEGLFFLDFLTGDLTCGVIQNRPTSALMGKFASKFSKNILNDFGGVETKNPKFLMVTGQANLPRGRNAFSFAQSVVYVGEATTGLVAVYAMPWNPAVHNSGQPQQGTLLLMDVRKFRDTVIRPE